MIFNKLRFVGATSVDLPIIGADPAGPFVLKGVDGLGPPEREVTISRTVQEGGKRQGTRTHNRQIVARVGLQPEWDIGQTPAELRTILYGLLTPKYGLPVVAQIMLGGTVIAQSQGDISRFETALFSKDPEVQITLDCDYPYLKSPTARIQMPEKSVVDGKTAIDIENEGTAPAGFWMSFTLQSAQPTPLQISDDSAFGQIMEIGGLWEAGDTLIIDTRTGQRNIWKTRSGTTVPVSAIGDLSGTSPWMQLHGGDNRLLINNLAFDFVGNGFEHTPAYWGV